MEFYRPIGLDWFDEGFWAINDQYETAKQYLAFDQAYRPKDGTPALNEYEPLSVKENEIYFVKDPGGETQHKACTLQYFKDNKFDFIIASIPQHIAIFKDLIAKYQPEAKLIVQMGNEWPMEYWQGNNVLASVKARPVPADCNEIFYHQEIDLKVFWWETVKPSKKIYSFVNVLENMPRASRDFEILEQLLPDYQVRSYGGQNRDGNMTGDRELADKMREAQFILHVKDHGDGFGHVIHSAYAVGRPVITRLSDYKGKLAEDLLVEGTYLDIDSLGRNELVRRVRHLTDNPGELAIMGDRAAQQFRSVVNYDHESEEIGKWLKSLR